MANISDLTIAVTELAAAVALLIPAVDTLKANQVGPADLKMAIESIHDVTAKVLDAATS